MASNLEAFGLAEMLRCSLGVRKAMRGAPTMESAVRRACAFLRDELVTADGDPAAVMVRCYKTHPFAHLEPDLQRFASGLLESGARPRADLKCLTLMATVGDEPEWNDRRLSAGHQAIPLASAEMVERAPMIAQLIRSFGLKPNEIVEPSPDIVRDLRGRTYGVFHVEDAHGSQFIPAQGFVDRHGVRSVIGFGGSLPPDDLFAVIVFARVRVDHGDADRFRNLALDLKSLLFSYGPDQVFDQAPAAAPT